MLTPRQHAHKNLQMNMDEKAEEMRNLLGEPPQYRHWLAQYMVVKRASIEPNHHALYLAFIGMFWGVPLLWP